jgi:hypothetical protein
MGITNWGGMRFEASPPGPLSHPLSPNRERGNDEETAVSASKGPPSPFGRGIEGEVSEGRPPQRATAPGAPLWLAIITEKARAEAAKCF